jgi:hypothetical protein
MIKKSVTISIVLLALSISLLLLPPIPWQKHERYLPEQFEATRMVGTAQQQFAQQFWAISIAVVCGYILVRRRA